jgi:hypothetical protein
MHRNESDEHPLGCRSQRRANWRHLVCPAFLYDNAIERTRCHWAQQRDVVHSIPASRVAATRRIE